MFDQIICYGIVFNLCRSAKGIKIAFFLLINILFWDPSLEGGEFSGCLLHLLADKLEPAVKPGQAALSLAGMSDAQPSIR